MKNKFLCLIQCCLLAGCAAEPSSSVVAPASQNPSPQYYVVYALSNAEFLFDGKHYDDKGIASAITSKEKEADAIPVVILRDGGRGLTVGQLLTLLPAMNVGYSCAFIQDSGGKSNTITRKQKDGAPEERSFCPSLDEVVAKIGVYSPPPTN